LPPTNQNIGVKYIVFNTLSSTNTVSITTTNYIIILQPGQTGIFESNGTIWNIIKCPPQIVQMNISDVSLKVQTFFQIVSQLSITLNPGTYTISYMCFPYIILSKNINDQYNINTFVYINNSIKSQFNSCALNYYGNFIKGSQIGGCVSNTQTCNLTSLSTIQIYVDLSNTNNVNLFFVKYSSINAMLLI